MAGSSSKRNKTFHFTTMLKAELENAGAARMRTLVNKAIELAEAGDMTALKYIVDRMEGGIPQHLTLAEDAEAPFKSIVLSADEMLKKLRAPTQAQLEAIVDELEEDAAKAEDAARPISKEDWKGNVPVLTEKTK
jgi:hypothetical protein